MNYNTTTKKHLAQFIWMPYFEKLNGAILDVGCSVGTLASVAPERVIGIDKDKKALEINWKKGFKAKYADVEKELPFKENFFAGIFCSHVIEHLNNPLFLMKEMFRVLKKDGKLVLLTPDYILTHDKESGFWSDYTHKRPFIKISLKKIAFDAGFRNFSVKHRIGQFKGMTFITDLFGLELAQKFFPGVNLILEGNK